MKSGIEGWRFLMLELRRMTILLMLACIAPQAISAQATRVGTKKAKPRLTLGDTLTIVASPSTVSFNLVEGGTAPGSTTVTMTTSWTGISLFSSLSLSGFFSSESQALSGGTPVFYIPSTAIMAKVTTGDLPTFTAFTQTAPLGGAGDGLELFTQTTLLSLGGSRTDVLSLEINLAGVPQVPAGTYTGALTLQAQAF
jgi:hypothetical protein